jgi:hypothetical protein
MSTFSAVACSRVDTEILRDCGQIVSNVNLKKHSNQSRFIELLQFKVVDVWVIFFSNLLGVWKKLMMETTVLILSMVPVLGYLKLTMNFLLLNETEEL